VNYCSECGARVALRIPEGEDRPRHVCPACATVHYQNPKLVVGSLPVSGERILLCRRAIDPRRNTWTLPAGWLENGETVAACALRETFEEAWATVTDLQAYTLVNLPHINQLYLILRARLVNQDFRPGPESLEVRLFSQAEIPWDNLAFSAIEQTLRHYCQDYPGGVFPFRILDGQPLR
jgi:ADP-ribose pyrophosphatase YjhB (NUDIX family)